MERIIRIVGIVNKCDEFEMIKETEYISLKKKGSYFPLETIVNDSEYDKAKGIIAEIISQLRSRTISYDKDDIKMNFYNAMGIQISQVI